MAETSGSNPSSNRRILPKNLPKNPKQAKRYINIKLKEHQVKKIYLAAEEKSKVRGLYMSQKSDMQS